MSTLAPDDDAILARLTGRREPWKQFLLDNPDAFILHYFGDRIHRLEPFHLELLEVAMNYTRGLVLYPAGHGKTTIISTLVPIIRICRDPNVRIVISAKNDAEAENIMRSILVELEDNEKLIRDFGPFKPEPGDKNKPWSLSAMTVRGRTRNAKSPTISCFGARARQLLGMRTDLTICDDVVTTENSASPTQRQKMREWFDMYASTGPEFDDSQLIVVGTLFHPEDLYADLIDLTDPEDGSPIWEVRQIDAIVDEEQHVTLWPEVWPWRRLMRKKAEMGTLEFNKRYRNIAVDPSMMLFKEEYIKGGWVGKQKYPGCLDKTYRVGDFDESWRRVSGFDPAVGLQRNAKFCAHITLAAGSCQKHERCLWVVDCNRDQWTLPQQVDRILDWHVEYGLTASWIEANAYQMGLYQAVRQKMDERGLALRIDPHYTNRSNKPDPEIGVERLVAWFEQGKVHIPQGDETSLRKMRQLIDELVQYPGRTTDTVMALWIAWLALEQSAPKYQSSNRLKRGMAWDPRSNMRRRVANPYYAKTG